MSKKMTKCVLCDKPPVIWYWFGLEEEGSLAACTRHEKRIEWVRFYSSRIERITNGKIYSQEIEENGNIWRQMKEKRANSLVPIFLEIPETSWIPETPPEMSKAPSKPNDVEIIDDSKIPELPVVPDDADDEWVTVEEIPETEHAPDSVNSHGSISPFDLKKRIDKDDLNPVSRRVFSASNGKADLMLIMWKGAIRGFLLIDGIDVLTFNGKNFGEYFRTTNLETFGSSLVPILIFRENSDPIDLGAMLKHFREMSKNIPKEVRDFVLLRIKEYRRVRKLCLLNLFRKRRSSPKVLVDYAILEEIPEASVGNRVKLRGGTGFGTIVSVELKENDFLTEDRVLLIKFYNIHWDDGSYSSVAEADLKVVRNPL